jgi:hypothetical protein
MKRVITAAFAALLLSAGNTVSAQTSFKVVTIVESIIPAGIGRSRIIETLEEQDASALSTERVDGTDSDQGKVKRKDAKVDNFVETKLLNFFSVAGINFQNIASNDALIASKINELIDKGWKLTYVTSAVESDGGKEDGNGIFITRLFFSR